MDNFDRNLGLGFIALGIAVLFGMFVLIASSDIDDWTRINNNCFLHVTQNKHAFSKDAPTHRIVYCEDKGQN